MTAQLSWYRRIMGGPDVASCMQVGRELQSFLDGRVEGLTADRIERHLERCRRCGMKADTYREIKASLARRQSPVDPDAVARLRAFGEQLVAHGDAGDNLIAEDEQ